MDNAINYATELITHFEGFRTTAYQDSADIWTIGYGHTKNVYKGMTITKPQAIEFLKEDLADSTKRLSVVKIPLNDQEKAVMLSLGYNLTTKSYNTLAGHLNKDKKLFREKLLLYSKDVAGNYLKGLLIRRIAERLLFEGRDWKEFTAWAQKKESSIDDIKDRMEILFS